MDTPNKILSSAVCIISLSAFLTTCSGSGNGALNSVYKADINNDGIIDAVYRYTLDVNSNQIKVEIDANNDGCPDKACCYNLHAEAEKNLFKKVAGGNQWKGKP